MAEFAWHVLWAGQKKSPDASRGAAADASAVEGSSPPPEAEGASASADAQTFAEFLDSRVSFPKRQCPCRFSTFAPSKTP